MKDLPKSVRVEADLDCTRVLLPARPRTVGRAIGLLPIGFGLMFVAAGIFWIGSELTAPDTPEIAPGPEGPALAMPEARDPTDRWISAAFGLPFIIMGFLPIGFGVLLMMNSRAEIEVTGQELRAIQRLGPMRFTSRRPLAQVKALRVTSTFSGMQSKGTYAIVAAVSEGRDLNLAPRYKRNLAAPVAEYLCEELQRRGATLTLDAADIPAPVTKPDEDAPTPAEQPAGSKIAFIATQDALTFIVPRTGFRGLAGFLLLFALIWDSVSFTVFAAFLIEALHQPSFTSIATLLFTSLFAGIGVATSLWCVQVAFRRTVVVATRDTLVVTQAGPLRSGEFAWKPADITALKVAESGTTVNNRKLKEFQVHAKEQEKHGFFDGRDEAELAWIAGTLRTFYGV